VVPAGFSWLQQHYTSLNRQAITRNAGTLEFVHHLHRRFHTLMDLSALITGSRRIGRSRLTPAQLDDIARDAGNGAGCRGGQELDFARSLPINI
jgi:hypothetical protein